MSTERIIREQERKQITGISRSHWWRLIRQGKAPQGVKLGERAVGWKLSQLQEWIETREAA